MDALIPRIKDKKSIVIFTASMLLIALLVSTLVGTVGISGGVFLLLFAITPIAIFCVIKFPRFGVVVFMISAYFIMFIINLGLVNFPLGTVMDSLLLLLLIGFLVNQKINPNWEILNNSISVIILIWIVYNVIEVVNPNAESRLAWMYTIRALAGVMLSYFIFMYQIRTIKFVRFIIKIWLFMSVIAAVYALKQEYIGFSAIEQRNLDNNPLLADLLFIDGHWRKFSIFADPISFSYNMNISSILCVGLMFGPISRTRKIILGFLIVLFMYTMLFSGTRSAYILLPVALSLLFILNLNFKMVVGGVFFVLAFLFLVYVPTSNYTLYRFQTAFKPSDDASFNVRKRNQKMIQPYIQTHIIGGGLGSSGASGAKFSPNSVLGSFPPDSGYVRAGIEQGWLGLILLCSMFFIALRKGINNYFKIKDPELKSYCLSMTLIIFALCIGNYPQEGLLQFPLNIYFCFFMALINITLTLDQKKDKEALIVDQHA